LRLFFAFELPADVRAVLARLRPKDASGDYRWTDPALLHLTLAFLGEQPEGRLGELEHIGAAAASASRPGRLRLGQAGAFGARRAPRVVWVDVAGDVEALLSLQATLASGLNQAGFPVEDRPFRAHVTLARRRETAQGGPPQGWPPEVEPASFALRQLSLMHSRLGRGGPTYTALFRFPIGG
jgi:2'-5' RNA ligase